MKTKRTKRSAEITVETDEIVVLKGSPGAVRLHCPACRRDVRMISPEQAARIAGVSTRTIYAWVESGKVHPAETSEGSLIICLDSLNAAVSGGQSREAVKFLRAGKNAVAPLYNKRARQTNGSKKASNR